MMRHGYGAGRLVAGLALAAALSSGVALADPQPATAPPAAAAPGAPDPAALDVRKQELGGIETSLTRSEEERRKIVGDIEAIRADRATLNAALIETTQHIHDAESKIAANEARLDTMTASQTAIRQSLESRRGVLAEVLASLQRMGRKPPPAMLASPDDILRTIRTSMMLGAVLPELRSQAEALASDLADLARLRRSISAERDTLSANLVGMTAEQHRLDALVAARQQAQADAETALGAEQGRAAELGRQATTLKDLIARMEGEIGSARRAGDAARAADDERRRMAQAEADSVRQKSEASAARDPARLSPAIDFAEARSTLAFPVSGRMMKAYGAADEFGGTEKGVSLATRPRAVVSAPADAWVAFSGPYRSYGQILILNAGSGYYIVLAGMATVDVVPGQFVLAGEPVATMGDGRVKTAAAIALGAVEPVLYVEFRKDGAAIDPTPWWAKAELEKVRG